MFTPRRLLIFAAVLCVALGTPLAAANLADPPPTAGSLTHLVGDVTSAPAALTASEQRTAVEYWTQKRMNAAQMRSADLLDLPVLSTDASQQEPHAQQSSAASRWSGDNALDRSVGKVYFTLDGVDYVCSATVVDSTNRNTLVTAGHCLNSGPGEFATHWIFIPDYDNGAEPYGRWSARQFYTPAEWSESGDLDYDIGFVTLNTRNNARIADVVGTQNIAFHTPRGEFAHSFGYPATSPYSGNSLYMCSGTPRPDTHGGTGQGIPCDMTEGSSGGPWLSAFDTSTGRGTVTSVNSFGYVDTPDTMWGPFFGTTAANLYAQASQ